MNPIFQLSIDARMIYERLTEAKVGDIISYALLSAIIGRDVQAEGRGAMETARKKAMRDNRMVFAPVRGEGMKCLNDSEIVSTAEADLSKMRRASRRAVVRIANVNFDKLPNEKKVQQNALLSMFGALAAFTSQSNIKALEKKVAEAQTTLPLAKTLEVFK